VTLPLIAKDPSSWYSAVQGPLPHLETLVLHNCSFADDSLQSYLHSAHSQQSVPRPRLKSTDLACFTLDNDFTYKLVARHAIQKLRYFFERDSIDVDTLRNVQHVDARLSEVAVDAASSFDTFELPQPNYY
jgi:hypothetical protein